MAMSAGSKRKGSALSSSITKYFLSTKWSTRTEAQNALECVSGHLKFKIFLGGGHAPEIRTPLYHKLATACTNIFPTTRARAPIN